MKRNITIVVAGVIAVLLFAGIVTGASDYDEIPTKITSDDSSYNMLGLNVVGLSDCVDSQEVKFKGNVIDIIYYISGTCYKIQIDEIISDITGNMSVDDTANVWCWFDSAADVDSVSIGDSVVVFGEYTSYFEGVHGVSLASSEHSLKLDESSQEVQFNGILTDVDSSCLSYDIYPIQIDDIISDPTGSMVTGDAANVWCWFDSAAYMDHFQVGDKVEVYGTYGGYKSGMHRIYLESSEHSLKNLEDFLLFWKNETSDYVHSVSVSENGEYVAIGSKDTYVYYFNKFGDLIWKHKTNGAVKSVSTSNDGNYVIAGSDDHHIYYFDKNGLLWEIEVDERITTTDISSDGRYAIAGSWNKYVYFFDSHDSNKLLWKRLLDVYVVGVGISDNGGYVAIGGREYVYLLDKYNTTIWEKDIGGAVDISDDGNYIIVGGGLNGRTTYCYDRSGELEWDDPYDEYLDDNHGGFVSISSVSLSTDGSYSAVGSFGWDLTIRSFDKTGNVVWRIKNDTYAVDISGDGHYIAAGASSSEIGERILYIDNFDNGNIIYDYSLEDPVWEVDLSKDGKYFAAAAKNTVYFFGPRDIYNGFDGDGDGVINLDDKCKNTPGPACNDGCPTTTDTDNDGLQEDNPSCPNYDSHPNDHDNDGITKDLDCDDYDPTNACQDAVLISNFPNLFSSNSYLVVGENAAAIDAIGGIKLINELAYTGSSVEMKYDTEMSGDTSHNIISVGGPIANSITANLDADMGISLTSDDTSYYIDVSGWKSFNVPKSWGESEDLVVVAVRKVNGRNAMVVWGITGQGTSAATEYISDSNIRANLKTDTSIIHWKDIDGDKIVSPGDIVETYESKGSSLHSNAINSVQAVSDMNTDLRDIRAIILHSGKDHKAAALISKGFGDKGYDDVLVKPDNYYEWYKIQNRIFDDRNLVISIGGPVANKHTKAMGDKRGVTWDNYESIYGNWFEITIDGKTESADIRKADNDIAIIYHINNNNKDTLVLWGGKEYGTYEICDYFVNTMGVDYPINFLDWKILRIEGGNCNFVESPLREKTIVHILNVYSKMFDPIDRNKRYDEYIKCAYKNYEKADAFNFLKEVTGEVAGHGAGFLMTSGELVKALWFVTYSLNEAEINDDLNSRILSGGSLSKDLENLALKYEQNSVTEDDLKNVLNVAQKWKTAGVTGHYLRVYEGNLKEGGEYNIKLDSDMTRTNAGILYIQSTDELYDWVFALFGTNFLYEQYKYVFTLSGSENTNFDMEMDLYKLNQTGFLELFDAEEHPQPFYKGDMCPDCDSYDLFNSATDRVGWTTRSAFTTKVISRKGNGHFSLIVEKLPCWGGDCLFSENTMVIDHNLVSLGYFLESELQNSNYVSAGANSPVNLHAYDQYGRHVGVNLTSNSTIDLLIPDAYYSGPDSHPEMIVVYNDSLDIKFFVDATGDGVFNLTITKKNDTDRVSTEYLDIPLTNDTNAIINAYSKYADDTLYLDLGGDNFYESEISPDSVTIEETVPPFLDNISYPSQICLGESINIEVSIADSSMVENTSVYILHPSGCSEKMPMNYVSLSAESGYNLTCFAYTFTNTSEIGSYEFYVLSEDIHGNSRSFGAYSFGNSLGPIRLHPDWNLISIPLVPEDTNTASVLSPISGNYSIIWEYNASDTADHWKKYDPSAPFGNDLTNLEPGKGYWILMTSDNTLHITGTVPESTDIDLKTGWNLIGYNSLDSQPITDALSSISGNYDIVWEYDASDTTDHWKKYDPNAPFGNDLTDVGPGKGYWILMNSDDTLEI